MSLVSVIILNWNGVRLLLEYLPSVVQYSPKDIAEVIVADNGSTDDSIKVLQEEFPSVRIIALDKNYGFAQGYNLAIQEVNTPYCVLLNDDVRVTEHWLEPMLTYMESNPNTGALQPKLLSDRQKDSFEYAGAAGGYLDKFGYPYCRGRIFDVVEKDLGQYDCVSNIMWATGACLMVRTELFRKAGGLDNHFFAHMEEIDLCWRIRNMGHDIVCIHESKVYHYGGASLAMGNPRKTKLNFRNSLLMLYKNLPTEKRKRVIFARMLLDGVAALNFLLHGQLQHVKAIWNAHREANRMIKDIYSLSSPSATASTSTASAASRPERPYFKEESISILWHYYIKGEKTYSKLSLLKQKK